MGTDFKNVSVKDTTMWRWKEQVIQKTSEALLKLGFFGAKHDPLSDAALP